VIFFFTAIIFEMLYNKVFIELDKKQSSKKGKPKGPTNMENNRNNEKSNIEWVNQNGCTSDETDTLENSGDDDGWTEVKSKARGKGVRQHYFYMEIISG
jgi:hypothetical protein